MHRQLQFILPLHEVPTYWFLRLWRPALCQRQARSHQQWRTSGRRRITSADSDHAALWRSWRCLQRLHLSFCGSSWESCFLPGGGRWARPAAAASWESVISFSIGRASALFSAGVEVWHNKGWAVKFYSTLKNMHWTQFRLHFFVQFVQTEGF